ncbi:MAG: CvpA family protein [Candidatus Omnitrophota bacterium]|nr:CvpA family protein [Candidatus Omnitrophota bacterium]
MELIAKINWVDVLVAILMLRISYVAFRDGLSHEIFSLLGSFLIVILAMRYYTVFGSFISRNMVDVPVEISDFLSFLILVVSSGLLVRVVRIILDKVVKVEWHPMIERFGGLAVGMMKAYIVTGIVLMTLSLMPLSYLKWSIKDKSLTGKYFLAMAPEIRDRLGGFLPETKADKAAKPAVSKKPANK